MRPRGVARGRRSHRQRGCPEAAPIRRSVEAVEAEDLDAYARIVAHDRDLAWCGSMPGQIVGWNELEPLIREMFEGLSDFRITQTDLRVLVSPDRQVAWAPCLWDFRAKSGDQEVAEPTRCTWVLSAARSAPGGAMGRAPRVRARYRCATTGGTDGR